MVPLLDQKLSSSVVLVQIAEMYRSQAIAHQKGANAEE